MGSHKLVRAIRNGSAEKENRSPKKRKRTVSISGLFETKHRTGQKSGNDAHDILLPIAAGVSKTTSSKFHTSSRLGRPKKVENNPLYRSFTEVTQRYRQSVEDNKAQQLQPVYAALVARVDSLGFNEQPLNNSGMSQREIDAFIQDDGEVSKRLEEEMLTIKVRKNGKYETRDVKLGDTMRVFEKLVQSKRTEMESLLSELRELNMDIAAAKEDVVKTEHEDVRKLNHELDLALENMVQEALDAKEQTLAEVKQARKDEQAALTEERRKLDSLMTSLP